jgi:hypothetical protein
MSPLSRRLLRIAVLYWVCGVSWGIYMGATKNFNDVPVHAHLNLLGWVSLGLCGLIYAKAPHLEQSLLAKAHFWLHNLGLPPLMIAVWLIVNGHEEIGGPLAGIFSVVMGLGVLSFAVNLWLKGFPLPAGESQSDPLASSMRSMSASLNP